MGMPSVLGAEAASRWASEGSMAEMSPDLVRLRVSSGCNGDLWRPS